MLCISEEISKYVSHCAHICQFAIKSQIAYYFKIKMIVFTVKNFLLQKNSQLKYGVSMFQILWVACL